MENIFDELLDNLKKYLSGYDLKFKENRLNNEIVIKGDNIDLLSKVISILEKKKINIDYSRSIGPCCDVTWWELIVRVKWQE